MNDLRELYQEVILDHRKRPRNFRDMAGANRRVNGFNPLCGDKITVYLRVEGGVIRDVSFQGSGCAISTASASMMTESLVGKPVEEALEMFRSFHQLVTGQEGGQEGLGKLAVFAGVAEFPVRVKCATLPWHTLKAALEESKEPVTTE
jgi:nitrogen fixation NifU-like protein